MSLASSLSPTAYWYLTRATGIVALVLLTASVVLGILGSLRFTAERWPRFAIDSIHRDVSLLVMVILVVHIVTTVLDGFAPITLLDGVIPFRSPYRPLWLGLGAFAFDLMLAIVVTSLVRRRIGYRAWRGVHWLAYASWPVAVAHGLGTGSDSKQLWALAVTFACVAAVTVAVVARIVQSDRISEGRRTLGVAAALLTPLALAAFTVVGPLASGWARRAGTPTKLLFSAHRARTVTVAATPTATTLKVPFNATLAGTIRESSAAGGAILDMALRLGGGAHGLIRIRLAGAPQDGGGLSLTGSQVDLLADGLPVVMEGRITQLEGQRFTARVTGAAQAPLDLDANLQIDNQSGVVTGTLRGSRAR
jgi:hypothetical protein